MSVNMQEINSKFWIMGRITEGAINKYDMYIRMIISDECASGAGYGANSGG